MFSPDQPLHTSLDTIASSGLTQHNSNHRVTGRTRSPSSYPHLHHWSLFRKEQQASQTSLGPKQRSKTRKPRTMAKSIHRNSIFPLKWNSEQREHRINRNNIHHNMALFDRSELVLGELIGKGAFCFVHELQDVNLNNGMVRPYFSRPWWDNKLHQTERTREYIRQTCNKTTNNDEDDSCSTNLSMQQNGDEECSTSSTSRPRYVVKHLRPNLTTERSYKVFMHAAADLRMEYEILSRLSHPNIVQLRGGAVSETGGSRLPRSIEKEDYFLLLERLDQTLSQRIHYWKRLEPPHHKQNTMERPTSPPFFLEKLRFARDIASALAYMHGQRFIFRDLKPDNCAISCNGTLKLIDFGLCRELPKSYKCDDSNGTEQLFRMSGVGTRRYMAPEMILGGGYNHKIDCYSWAMVLYEMISLQKPYATYNRDVHKILVCENEDRPRLSLDVPLQARKLLQQAWAQNPFNRLSMTEICNELDILIDSSERQALTVHERSLKMIMEMAELFTLDILSPCNKKDDSLVSRKSIAELTVSTSTSAGSDNSLLSPAASLR